MGKYILRYSDYSECWEILRQNNSNPLEYETVIPNAGPIRDFAYEILNLLNEYM